MALPAKLPSPFYRGTIKALIFDDQKRLLVVQNMDHQDWEMPGGGWEHNEAFDECLRRELNEELGVEPASIGPIAFAYRGEHRRRQWLTLRLAVPVQLKNFDLKLGEEMMAWRFVTKAELLKLYMESDEAPIRDYVDQIWPPVEKNA